MKKYLVTAVLMLAVLLSISAYAATVTVTDGNLIGAMEGLDLSQDNTVILASDVVYENYIPTHTGRLTIKGDTATRKFSFAKDVQLYGPTTFDNLVLDSTSTLYAAGFHLIITDTVTTTSNITIYGAKYEGTFQSTNLEIYGGKYGYIYAGGGSGSCTITGDTNVTFGGSAVANYVFGGGKGANSPIGGETNVYIKGGEVSTNVFGGAEGTALNCNTNVYMTGGTVEGVFGGSISASLTGNANVTVTGGTITRRIYSGCYNNTQGTFSLSFTTDYYVKGTTTLAIGPNVSLSFSDTNQGLFAGSRTAGSHDDEVNTLIFLDNSYSSLKGEVGEQGLIHASTFKSFEDYVVSEGTGGTVVSANEAGKIKVIPDSGKYATVNSQKYYESSVVLASSSTLSNPTAVTFDAVKLTASKGTTGMSVTTDVAEPTITGVTKTVFVAVYNPAGKMVGYAYQPASTTFEVACDTSVAGTYTVKAMVVDSNCSPLTDVVSTTVAVA